MVAERPKVLLTNRAWMHPDDVPNGLYDAFYYETTEKVQDDEGIWVEQVKPIDLVADSAKGYVGFPRGDINKLRRWLPQAQIIDRRQIAPLGFDLELDIEKLSGDQRWTDQQDMIERWYKTAGGVLVAPPGSGKSIVGVGMTCKVGLRTLFLFDRKDFRDHWLKEFHQFTNLGDLEEVAGEPLAGAFKAGGRKNLKLWPITFATFQQMNTPRVRRFLRENRDYFGMVICDETHHVTSPTFRSVILQLNPFIVGGATATPERKDKLERIYYDVLGPVNVVGGQYQLNPLVWLHKTNFTVTPSPYRADHTQFGLFLDQIRKAKDRNLKIIKRVYRELRQGRVPLIVSERVEHCDYLKRMLSKLWDADRIAVAHHKIKKRPDLYRAIDEGHYDCLIASKVIDEGVNIIRLDTLHLATPLASKGRVEQRINRITRPFLPKHERRWGKKNRPVVHDYIDEGHGQITGSAWARRHVYAKLQAEVRDAGTRREVRMPVRTKRRRA